LRIVAVSDIHGRISSLRRILHSVGLADFVLMAGHLAFGPRCISAKVLREISR